MQKTRLRLIYIEDATPVAQVTDENDAGGSDTVFMKKGSIVIVIISNFCCFIILINKSLGMHLLR